MRSYFLLLPTTSSVGSFDLPIVWTDNTPSIYLYFAEYSFNLGPERHYKIIEYTDCKNANEFAELVLHDHQIPISEYNKLNIEISEHDPEVYHASTQQIYDNSDMDGLYDMSHSYLTLNIVRAFINISALAKYIKPPEFSEYIEKMFLKYVAQYILLDDGILTDSQTCTNPELLSLMGIKDIDQDCYDGIYSLVDYVMYSKMVDGIEL